MREEISYQARSAAHLEELAARYQPLKDAYDLNCGQLLIRENIARVGLDITPNKYHATPRPQLRPGAKPGYIQRACEQEIELALGHFSYIISFIPEWERKDDEENEEPEFSADLFRRHGARMISASPERVVFMAGHPKRSFTYTVALKE